MAHCVMSQLLSSSRAGSVAFAVDMKDERVDGSAFSVGRKLAVPYAQECQHD